MVDKPREDIRVGAPELREAAPLEDGPRKWDCGREIGEDVLLCGVLPAPGLLRGLHAEPPVDDLTDLPGGRDVELGARLLIGLFLKPLHPLAELLRRLAESRDRDGGAGPLHQGEHGD